MTTKEMIAWWLALNEVLAEDSLHSQGRADEWAFYMDWWFQLDSELHYHAQES